MQASQSDKKFVYHSTGGVPVLPVLAESMFLPLLFSCNYLLLGSAVARGALASMARRDLKPTGSLSSKTRRLVPCTALATAVLYKFAEIFEFHLTRAKPL